jgi:transposase
VRTLLPEGLARTEFLHEPDSTACATPGCGKPMQRIGQSVTDKLHYTPGTFSVHRHVRGKWVCRCCDKLVQEPVPAQVIDKGLPTAGLLAYVLVAKYADHLPLARQEHIFGRAGVAIPRSTLAQWVGHCGVQLQPLVDALRTEVLACPVLHADETPVQMLKPGIGKTHRAYLWVYAPVVFDPLRAVIYDFCESRAGKHANAFLAGWQGHLVVDDYKGYKQLLGRDGITEVGCLAHARRKFFDLNQANQSTLATKALEYFSLVYDIERDVRNASTEERLRMRQQHTKPALKAMQDWMTLQRQKVPEGSATAKALDYSLRRWDALTRFVDHGGLPADNNHVERQIRPIAIGRNNWLFAGSLRGGERAAAVMSLVHSARLNGLDPLAYLTDVLERLPTHKMSAIGELLPHRWTPPAQTTAA